MFIDQNVKSTLRDSEGRNETKLSFGQVEFRPSDPRRSLSDYQL
jgi:hypothetical protein